MQRTLIVHTGERLIKRENWLVLQSDGTEKRVFDLPTATPKERRAYT